ncbi:NfeD family protein [Candidatus Dependentiae bacterium]|nr:NfeD family protein [Candidatus Dependentiae bacterium]
MILTPFYLWTLIGIVLILLELCSPGLFVCLAFGISGLSTGLLSFLFKDFSWHQEFFVIYGAIIFFVLKLKIEHFNYSHKQNPHITSNIQSLIGKQAHLEQPLSPGECGYAYVEKELWSCKNNSQTILTNDVGVIVVNIQGNTLILKSKELS